MLTPDLMTLAIVLPMAGLAVVAILAAFRWKGAATSLREELDRIPATRSAATAAGNRTRAQRRREQKLAKLEEIRRAIHPAAVAESPEAKA